MSLAGAGTGEVAGEDPKQLPCPPWGGARPGLEGTGDGWLMKLRFLGTAASEGYPDAFCDCANCRRAREVRGRSLRRRSAALVNDDLLIDFGPDLMAAALM